MCRRNTVKKLNTYIILLIKISIIISDGKVLYKIELVHVKFT